MTRCLTAVQAPMHTKSLATMRTAIVRSELQQSETPRSQSCGLHAEQAVPST